MKRIGENKNDEFNREAIQEDNRIRAKYGAAFRNPFYEEYVCKCGNRFIHSRVPRAIANTLRCEECKK